MQITKTDADPVKKVIFGNEYDKDGIVLFNSGFSVDASKFGAESTYIKKGTIVGIDTSGNSRTASPVKTAKFHSGEGTTFNIYKGSEFKVNDYISDGYISKKITAISYGTDYDTITIDGALYKQISGQIYYSAETYKYRAQVPALATVVEAATKSLAISANGLNGRSVILSQNGTDALQVLFASGILYIRLAKTSAEKNTTANIEWALRALGEVTLEGVDFTDASVVGTNWTDITGGTITTATDTFKNGSPVAPVPPYPTPKGIVWVSKKLEGTPSITVVATAHEVITESLPYPINDTIKDALSKWFTFE
jgi:hypothetical protein